MFHSASNLNYLPGPFSWPFFGNQFLVKRLTKEYGTQHQAFYELSKQYGSVMSLHLNNSNVFLVSGNRAILNVLKNELYDGRPWSEFIRLRNMGKKQGTYTRCYVSIIDGNDVLRNLVFVERHHDERRRRMERVTRLDDADPEGFRLRETDDVGDDQRGGVSDPGQFEKRRREIDQAVADFRRDERPVAFLVGITVL